MKLKERYVYAVSLFFLGLAIIFGVLTLEGCKNPVPAVDVSFWAGDSAKDGVSRAQENKTLKCSDPEFDNYTCLTYADIKKIMDLILSCQQWPAGTTRIAVKIEMKRFMTNNPEVIQHVSAEQYQERLEPIRN